MNPPFTLVLALLTIESSYSQDLERPATIVPDTVQFWFTPEIQWRIKTYAIDHDIHVHSVGETSSGTQLSLDLARTNIDKHYGDVVSTLIILEFNDPTNQHEVQRVLSNHKLPGILELVDTGYAFYNPDSSDYRSQTKPQ